MLDPGIADTLIACMLDEIETGAADYDCVGVRGDYSEPNGVSHVWIDGDHTDDELDGLCAIDMSTGRTCLVERSYCAGIGHADPRQYGSRAFVLAGTLVEHGEDNEEIVIGDYKIVAEINLTGQGR
jgi:hypothetical protein